MFGRQVELWHTTPIFPRWLWYSQQRIAFQTGNGALSENEVNRLFEPGLRLAPVTGIYVFAKVLSGGVEVVCDESLPHCGLKRGHSWHFFS